MTTPKTVADMEKTTEFAGLQIAVLDYGSGNVRSVMHALARAGADPVLTSDTQVAATAAGLVVPGVGAYSSVMRLLQSSGGADVIATRVASGRPTMGICVGLQVLFRQGTERGEKSPGLGYFSGSVDRLEAAVVPHMGWSTVSAGAQSRLLEGLDGERFYFLHSYAAPATETISVSKQLVDKQNHGVVISVAEHGQEFVAAVEAGPLFATQFHPEKSGAAGVALLRNWLQFVAQTQRTEFAD